jgi:hypothetical protein
MAARQRLWRVTPAQAGAKSMQTTLEDVLVL